MTRTSYLKKATLVVCVLQGSEAFVPCSRMSHMSSIASNPSFLSTTPCMKTPTSLQMSDDVDMQLAKAKELLAKAKAKIAETENIANGDHQDSVKPGTQVKEEPKSTTITSKKEQVLKSETESGLFTTDGDMMAELSEDEEWEMRSLLDVFEEEFSNDDAERRATDKKDRDIAMAMFNLRKQMITSDYKKIFDEKNWRIGEI